MKPTMGESRQDITRQDTLELDPTLLAGWRRMLCAGAAADVLLRLATRSDSLPYYDNLGHRLQGLVARTANFKSIQPLVSTILGAVHGWGKGEWEVLQSKTSTGSLLLKSVSSPLL